MREIKKWNSEDDKRLLDLYQNHRKTLHEIAEELGRTVDGVRNRLYLLRQSGQAHRTVTTNRVTVAVTMTSEEYDRMRGAFNEISNADKIKNDLIKSESTLSETMLAIQELLTARKNHRNTAPFFKKLAELSDKYYRSI